MDEPIIKRVKGLEKIHRALNGELSKFDLHDAFTDKMLYNGANHSIDLYIFDSWNRLNIHFRFSDVIEVKWIAEPGADIAGGYTMKYQEKGNYYEFELDSVYLRILSTSIEIISVRKEK